MTGGQDAGGRLGPGGVKLEAARYVVDVFGVVFNMALILVRAPSAQQLNIVLCHARPSGWSGGSPAEGVTRLRRLKADAFKLGLCPLVRWCSVGRGEGHLVRIRWGAKAEHARSPTAAMVMVMPWRKGPVLEAGRVKKSRSGWPSESLRPKVVDLHVACQLANPRQPTGGILM